MSGLLFWLPVVKMSWEKNSKKKPILLVNFCFLIHFDFSNTRIFSFSVGIKVMNPKMPLCIECNVCKKSVKTYSMKQHMKIFHSGPQLKFNCEHCEFQTIHKMNLNKHIMRKHERRPIEESRYDYDQIFKVFSTFEVETKRINVL